MELYFENSWLVEVQAGSLQLQNLGRDVGFLTTGDLVGASGTTLGLFRGDLAARRASRRVACNWRT